MSEPVNPRRDDAKRRVKDVSDRTPFSHPYFKKLTEQLARARNRAERLALLEQARTSAHKELPMQLAKLEKLLTRYNPFQVLAMFGFYDLTYLPDLGRRFNHSDPIEQYHIELVQALILCHQEEEFTKSVF